MLLLIDNFDSFTHNLARYFTELGQTVQVVRNDAITLAEIAQMSPSMLVFSPGPCTPNEAGITLAAIKRFAGNIPLFGVCLGHQSIGQAFGAKVVQANDIKHGKTSLLTHQSTGLFRHLPSRYHVTRYHSLVIAPDSLPDTFTVDAWCDASSGQREIMAVSHRALPIWGVQFHPESLLTEHGHDLLSAFICQAEQFNQQLAATKAQKILPTGR
ncbi:aminodeoxychorismate/anthranilate synthase component II [Alteromonas sp. C1M14]|uniref:anthranilate synthase component II n=1 Tax=Alteromonas sp. C1M14 TaxID=2841567 RepID=UPI001C0874C3|nr:aminodeoxychorismate/anthranilate synthase component II [Alteromonas sp. C1M14]MBU2978633.1 aminodeoxychorismate/anthranilate synthase component II [Alteromonas sp. C1M14]